MALGVAHGGDRLTRDWPTTEGDSAALRELRMRVTRIGGLSCVHSMKQEATRMANQGFHQWNFDVNADGAWVMINSNTKLMSNIDQLFAGILKPLDLARAEVIDVGETQFLKCYRKLTHPNATFG